MAPIDPNQLLAAFAPLLTTSGGIKNATEVPRLSSLMKKFSRKLVSRCVYCNVLLATNSEVLEEFLRSGGWETIHLWIKSAKELDNRPFLEELLKLLLILPMNVERLRENDSPKMIKSLSKSDNPVLAPMAKQIVDKWTEMITGAPAAKEKDSKKEHKKRKKDSNEGNSDSKDSLDTKRTKSTAKSEIMAIEMNSTDSNVSFESVKDSLKIKTVRPTTAKVKPGKSRMDLLVNSQTNANKTRKENAINSSKKLVINSSNKSMTTPNSEPQNASTGSLILKVKPQPIETKSPLSPTVAVPVPIVAAIPPPPPVKHVLHESTSFMDALMDTPLSSVKKKRRTSASSGKESAGANSADITSEASSSPKASPPKAFSFYKDMIDEKVDQRSNDSEPIVIDNNEDNDSNKSDEQNEQSIDSDVNEEEVNHMNVDITVPDISVVAAPSFAAPVAQTVISERSSSKQIKPILCYTKKGVKKSVRWSDENGKTDLQRVRFFELDETERVNVNRPPNAGTFGDIRRFDMRHEAELMLMARRSANTFDVSDDYSSRCNSFGTWRLIPCDGDTNLIEVGKESKEKHIQAERMRTILEAFYVRNQIPDAPQEADSELHLETEAMKTIPLEDENNPNNYHDFSQIDLPLPKTGEQLPPRVTDFSPKQPPINSFPSNQFPAAGPPPMMSAAPPNFAAQPMMQSFAGPPLLPGPEPFPMRMPGQQQFFAPNSGPPFNQWNDGGAGGPPHPNPPPPHFMPQFNNSIRGNRPPRLPRNAQNTVCRHFARTGKCRFQPKCNFLHSNDR